MVYIYAMDVTDLPDPKDFPGLLKDLPEGRKEKALKYRHEKDRRQSLGAGLLLKYVMELHGASQEEIHLVGNGKPEGKGICFNLSHSHNMVVCAVSAEEVGCDVEKIGAPPMKVVQRFFGENEIRHLEMFEKEEKVREFYRLWTMKESYMKMTGEGMRLALNRFEMMFEDRVRVCRDGRYQPCFVKEYEIPGYMLTVCAREDKFAEQVEWVS